MKKCLSIIFAALLMVSALTGCTGRNSSPEQNNATAPSGETTISQPATSTTGASSPTVSPAASAAYSINAPKLVTVAERDRALLTFKEEMQKYLNGLIFAK